jgi:hypothetical protein
MAEKIFNNIYQQTENISAQGALLTWTTNNGGGGHFPILVDGLQILYQRNVAPMYPINPTVSGVYKKLNIVGSPQGSMTCTGLVTRDVANMKEFLRAVSKECTDDTVTFYIRPFNASNCPDVNLKYVVTGLLLTSTGLTIQGADVATVHQPLSFTLTEFYPDF